MVVGAADEEDAVVVVEDRRVRHPTFERHVAEVLRRAGPAPPRAAARGPPRTPRPRARAAARSARGRTDRSRSGARCGPIAWSSSSRWRRSIRATLRGPVQPSRREPRIGGHQRARPAGHRRGGRRPPARGPEGDPHPPDRGPGEGGAVRRARPGDRCSAPPSSTCYSGSGALGIEALSRGATSALLVDRDPLAVDAIRRNLRSDRPEGPGPGAAPGGRDAGPGRAAAGRPLRPGVLRPALRRAGRRSSAGVLDALAAPGWLAEDAIVVVERSASAGPPLVPPGWGVTWSRVYGDTLVVLVAAATRLKQRPGAAAWPPHSARARSIR